ncbi:MAG: hypothetical protein JSV65_03555 [Armatimonadota bacterium]|nr:MAG: hypothetical protein JSV65_03555 [Armatimonadota bacterium]
MLLAAVIVVGLNQLGRVPVRAPFVNGEKSRYGKAKAITQRHPGGADVVVVGNSAAQFGIDAKQLARALRLPNQGGAVPEVINVAVPAGDPASSLWFWRHLTRADLLKTKLLIVGVAPIDFIPDSASRDFALRYLFDAKDACWLLRNRRPSEAAELLLYRALPLYAYRQAVRNLITRQPAPPPLPDGENNRMWCTPAYSRAFQGYRIDNFKERCLEQLIVDARGRGVQVLLLALPVHPSLQTVTEGLVFPGTVKGVTSLRWTETTKAPLWIFNHAIGDLARRHQVPFFNYLTKPDSRRFTYADPPHLNHQGAQRFTAELARRLTRELTSAQRRRSQGLTGAARQDNGAS